MEDLTNAFDHLVKAQIRLAALRRNGGPDSEIKLAEMDRDKARAEFDELLDEAE